MSGEQKRHPVLTGVLEALTASGEELEAATTDHRMLQKLCSVTDDVGPDQSPEDTTLVLAGLLSANRRLQKRFAQMVEDAKVIGVHSPPRGAAVYDCRCVRGLLVGLVASLDSGVASEIAARREILWPDDEIWPKGLPESPGAAFATIATGDDETRVGALGLAWLDSGILSESLSPGIRQLFQLLVDAGEEKERQAEEEEEHDRRHEAIESRCSP